MGLSGANPYLARALTKDLVRQHKVAQENEARAERARLDASELRELERELEDESPVTVNRRRGLRDRLRRRSA
jgi:hypothetical protein